jgi:hypothetical protein
MARWCGRLQLVTKNDGLEIHSSYNDKKKSFLKSWVEPC